MCLPRSTAERTPLPWSQPHTTGLRLRGLAAAILVGGWLAATVADVMAAQTRLSSGFVGATLLAAASSLPEVSTTVAAVRHGNEELAVSNVMGSNSFDVALLAVVSVMAADAFGRGPLASTVYMAALGTALTGVYLWGLLAHAQRSVRKVGWDSIAVVLLYVAGLGALYGLG
jgi:cation:H+ antiporter